MFGQIHDTTFLFVKNNIMRIAFCFDLDGTLTKEEILPQIAKHVDLLEEIDLLTNITMQGLITFSKSFKLRVKLLTSIPISKVKETVNGIKINKDLKQFVVDNKEDCYIVTGNLDVWVDDFIKKEFGCDYFSSEATYNGDQLIDVRKIIDKRDAIKELRESNKYDLIVCIGDGMNDCPMFEIADFGIAFGGVHEPVSTLVQMSKYVCYDSKSLLKLLESIQKHYKNEN